MSMKEHFKSILSTQKFERLEPYKNVGTWNEMSHDERELLGILFIKQAEHQFKSGDSKVTESFDLATKVAPASPMVYFHQALVYAAQGPNLPCLLAANEALKQATNLDPYFISAWHSWGNVLVRLGVLNDDVNCFYQAEEKFVHVYELTSNTSSRNSDSLYWHWGICLYHIGKHSGEVFDFFKALEKFKKGEEEGCESGEFHNDYGNVLTDLGCLVSGRKDLFVQAILHYKKFTELSPKNCEGWLNLACLNQRLYNLTSDYDYCQNADDCFERASELNEEDAIIWLRWAELYSSEGKISNDIEKIQASLEKFEKAYFLDPENNHVLLQWGEAQMLIAAYSEDLDLLREAKNKIVMSLSTLSHLAETWYIYGICLSEYGRYFATVDYYREAIEKFHCGLEQNSSHALIFHGLSLAHFAIGETTQDLTEIELAINYCNKVAEKTDPLPPQFLNDWGVTLMKYGEMTNEKEYIEQAAEKFEQAISRRLELAKGEDVELEWLYNYGCAMDFLGDFHEEGVYYEKAVQVLSHILRIDPDYTFARYNLALAFFHLGELNGDIDSFHKAIDLFHEVVQEDPEDEFTWNDYGLTLLNLAVLTDDPIQKEFSKSLFEQSEAKLQQALALGNINAFYNLACLHALTLNPVAALHYLERAEQSDALPPVEDIIHDEWLERLRHQAPFRSFISRLLEKQKRELEEE